MPRGEHVVVCWSRPLVCIWLSSLLARCTPLVSPLYIYRRMKCVVVFGRYEDTAGVEVDIATSISFCRVAELCSRLRFVVVVDCNTFQVDRGGAMRSVTKLVSSFVHSFSQHKLAFTFIFTKTDSLGAPKTADEARKLLFNTLSETFKGSSDAEVRKIIHWMMVCLHHKHPFVDIYHPALSDISELRGVMESFSRGTGANHSGEVPRVDTAVTSPSSAIRCGMTQKAEAQLKLDVRDLFEDLRTALDDWRVATAERLFGTIRFLQLHTRNSCVCEIHDLAMQRWEEFGASLLSRTHDLIERGTSLERSDSSTNCFSVDDGREVLRDIALLLLLERVGVPQVPPNASENALSDLRIGICELSHLVCNAVNAGSSFSPQLGSTSGSAPQTTSLSCLSLHWSDPLEMLRIWGAAHEEFSVVAEHAEAALHKAHVQALTVASALATSSETRELSKLLWASMRLAQLRESANQVKIDGVDTAATLDKCLKRIQQLVSQFQSEAAGALEATGNGEETDSHLNGIPDLKRFSSSLSGIEEACSLVAMPYLGGCALAELRDLVPAARLSILTEVKPCLHKLLDKVEGTADLQGRENLLATIAAISTSLSHTQHLECGTGGLYATAVSEAGGAIRALLERANASCTQALEEQRLVNPRRHAAALEQVGASAWLDRHLEACGHAPVVQDALHKLREEYTRWSARSVHAALRTLDDYLGLGTARCTLPAANFQAAASLVEQLSHLVGEVPEITEHVHAFSENAHTSLDRWYTSSKDLQQLGKLTYSATPQRDVLAAAVNEALVVCEDVGMVAVLAAQAKAMETPLIDQLSKLSASVRELFRPGSDEHEQQGAALAALHTWGEQRLMRVMEHLPKPDELQAKVVGKLETAKAAARAAVEEVVGDTAAAEAALSDLDALAKAFAGLECGQSAGQTLRDLEQGLGRRAALLEEKLRENLEQGKFWFVREYIQPLLASNDLLKREQLARTLAAAKDSLHAKYQTMKQSVANASAVVEAIAVLTDADTQIGEQLTQYHGFNSRKAALEVRELAAAHLTRLVEKLEVALPMLNYEHIFAQAGVVDKYLGDTHSLLVVNATAAHATVLSLRNLVFGTPAVTRDIRIRTKNVLMKVRACLDAVDVKVEQFVKDSAGMRKTGKSVSGEDTTELCNMLNKLQQSAGVDGSVDLSGVRLAERYARATQTLSSELKDVTQQVSSLVKTEQLFTMAIEVWTYVDRELDRGLKGHVLLDLDIEVELERLRSLNAMADDKLKASCLTIEELQSHVCPLLSNLNSKLSGGVWHQRQYRQRQDIFLKQIMHMLTATEDAVLKQGNFVSAGRTAVVLQHIFRSESLAEHIESGAVHTKWTRLSEMIVANFGRMSQQLKDALMRADPDLASFDAILRRIHEFEVGLFGVYAAVLQPEAQRVHEAIYVWAHQRVDALESQLQRFELGDAAESAMLLRRAGRVLVSTFALYLDVAEADGRHSTEEEWLGRLHSLCIAQFGFRAARDIGVHYAILELAPNAREQDVLKAFKAASLKYHPDRQGGFGRSSSVMQQRVVNARDALVKESVRATFKDLVDGVKAPFAKAIENVPKELLRRVQAQLEEQEYEQVTKNLCCRCPVGCVACEVFELRLCTSVIDS